MNEQFKVRDSAQFLMWMDNKETNMENKETFSGEQEQNIKTQKFARLLQAKQSGLITLKEFRDGCNKDNLLSVQVDLDIPVVP